MSLTKYPLTWPEGWKRTGMVYRGRAHFKTSRYGARNASIGVGEGVRRVLDELRRFGVQEGEAIISSNLRVRLDGLPRADQAEPADPGAAVYWERPGVKGTKVMAIDIYDRVADNLAAIAATLDAMRAIERHGGAQILERAFTGFETLPAPGQTSARSWRDVLGFGSIEQVTKLTIDDAYRKARSETHPDRPGGSNNAFIEVQIAYEQALAEMRP